MDWEAALAYAESAATAGYDDWRLPNIKELQSIVDYSKSLSASDSADQGPAIDSDFFEITELPSGTTNYDSDDGYFWSIPKLLEFASSISLGLVPVPILVVTA